MDNLKYLIPGKLYYFKHACGLYFNNSNNDSVYFKVLSNTDIFIFVGLLTKDKHEFLLKRKKLRFFNDLTVGIFLFGNNFGTINLKVGDAITRLELLGD